jgi:hypothetical protein
VIGAQQRMAAISVRLKIVDAKKRQIGAGVISIEFIEEIYSKIMCYRENLMTIRVFPCLGS